MPTTIKLKNSVTTTSVPSSLVQGEVAINITDKKVWVGNAATTPIQLLGGGADGNFTNISVSSVATFGAGTVSAPSITTTGDTNTGIFFPAADTIAFAEGGAESMRITADGSVLIGGTTDTGQTSGFLTIQRTDGAPGLDMFRNDTSIADTDVLTQIRFLGNDTTSNTAAQLAYIRATASGTHSAGDNPTDLVFATTPDGTSSVAEAGRITQSGAYILKGGTLNPGGIGITFPATQSASSDANTLDDYEEGTWTPTITRNSSNPTITYGTQLGVYVKIGRIVYVSCNVNWSANTGGSGSNWFISGLPFTNTNGGANYAQATIQDFNGITFSASRTQFGGYVNSNETRLFLCSGGSNQSTDNITVGSSGYMYMSGVYIASA